MRRKEEKEKEKEKKKGGGVGCLEEEVFALAELVDEGLRELRASEERVQQRVHRRPSHIISQNRIKVFMLVN
jgi:hypothetical protein